MNDNTDKKEEKSVEELIFDEELTNEDVIMQIFWKHIIASLYVFANTNISSEDAFDRYEKLLSQAHRFLKFGVNMEEEERDEMDKKIKEIVKLLLNKKRKIKIKLITI